MKIALSILLFCCFLTAAKAQTVTYTPLYTSASFYKTIDVSKPVGVIDGTSSVSESGAGTYSIPIKCPPGTHGLVPGVALTYNSQSQNGIAGMGWYIEGLSVIARVNKDMYHDGEVRVVESSYSDRFALDGNRLIGVSGTYGYSGSTYHPEAENFSTITSYGNVGNGPDWFNVITKDGTIMEYGNSSDSKFYNASGTEIMFWKLNKIQDINGNYIKFYYNNGNRDSRISSISYTGNIYTGLNPYNTINFSYKLRTDMNFMYANGNDYSSQYLLDKITVTGEGGQTYREYQLNYGNNNIYSFLKEIIESNGQGASLNSTIFKYGDQPNGFSVGGSNVVANQTIDLFSGDYDGDGVTDLLAADKAYSSGMPYHTGFKIYRRDLTTGNFTMTFSTSLPTNFTTVNKVDIPNNYTFLPSDFNGDGKEDVVVTNTHFTGSTRLLDEIDIYEGTGGGSFASTIPMYTPPSGFNVVSPKYNFFIPGDFDGDGTCDFVTILSNGGGYKAFFNSRRLNSYNNEISSFGIGSYNPYYPASSIIDPDMVYVIDYDGDDKKDIMIVKDAYSYIFSIVKTGSSYTAVLRWSAGYPTKWHTLYMGDFNGDKKTDWLSRTNTGYWEKAISTINNYAVSPFTDFTSHTPLISQPAQYSDDKLVIADYNGDGKSDILLGYPNWTGGSASTSTMDVYYSRGYNFQHEQYFFGGLLSYAPLIQGDLNGDGRVDLINRTVYTSPFDIFYFKADGRENLLHKVADGLGRTVTYNYMPLSVGGSLYTKGSGCSYPLNDIQYAFNVVSSTLSPNGIGGQSTTSYKYEGAVLHKSKGFLGFKKMISSNNTSDVKSETINEFNTTYYYPYRTEENTYLASTNTQLTHNTMSTSFVNTGGLSFFPRIVASAEQNSLSGAVTSTSNTYDAYGNITYSSKNINGIETINTSVTYVSANTPVPAKPSYITINRTRSGNAAVSNTNYFEYYSNGNLKKEIQNNSKPLKTTFSYTYDSYGNMLSESKSGTGIAYTPVTSYAYDSKGRFAVSTTNPLGQTSTTSWHALWGAPLSSTGVDGLTITNTYDGWGDMIQTNMPQGYSVNYSKAWSIGSGAYWYSLVSHPGKPDVKIWNDILGREIKRQTETYGGQWTTQTTSYMANGNVHTTTAPYLSSETPITTTKSYDAYGRLSTISNASGTSSYSYGYSGGNANVTLYDPNGQSSTTVTDATGKTIQSIDNGGTMNYAYDSWGNQTLVKHGFYVLTTNTYDAYGRRITMWDSDAGTTQYTYDAWGRITSEKDATGNTHLFTLDIMDRITQRNGPEGLTQYQYYGAGGGLANQLQYVTGYNGINDEYLYDGYGRLYKETKFISGTPYETMYIHDAYDNITDVTYPSGMDFIYTYDANGFLQNVNAGGGIDLFNANSMNGLGQYTSYDYGNGLNVTKTFDNGFPTRTYTPGIQDLQPYFDPATGLLNSRYDNIKKLIEVFSYDNLNRLTDNMVADVSTTTAYITYHHTINYDLSGGVSTGNIKSKTDVGDYFYGSKRHAVASVTNTPGNISLLQQDITYTPFQKALKVTEDNDEEQFTYDAQYQRVKTEVYHSGVLQNTRIYLGNYEENIDPVTGQKKMLHYVSGGDGLCAIIETTPAVYPMPSPLFIHYVHKDHLGSILATTDNAGNIETEQNFDPWGRMRNPTDWTFHSVPVQPSWLYRGYTGHEHMPQFTLINMNGRMYDPMLGRMMAPDNFVANNTTTQGYNRFSYANNNPLSYVDPDGNMAWFVPIIIGAAVGAYSGGVIANQGEYNPTKWSDSRTFGYVLGGAIIGGVSGGLGGAISGSGAAFANTGGIIFSSVTYTTGMAAMTDGAVSPSVSFGAASYDFETGKFGYLGKKGNKWYQNLGYTFGALSNLQDGVALFGGGTDYYVRAHVTKDDLTGHSSGFNTKEGIDISVAGASPNHYTKTTHLGKELEYLKNHFIPGPGRYYPNNDKGWVIDLHNVNRSILKYMSNNLKQSSFTAGGYHQGPGLLGIGKLQYGFLFGCQSHVGRSLWAVGIPTLPINFHPWILNSQLFIRQLGIYASPYMVNDID